MHKFNFPTTIYYGKDSLDALARVIKEKYHKRILLVTDQTLIDIGLSQKIMSALKEHSPYQSVSIHFSVFSDIHKNPIEQDVQLGAEQYIKEKCDAIIALGGGAPMDVAKGIKVLSRHEGPISRYEESRGGDQYIVHPMPTLYAIPTTAGTGSEVGRSAVIILKNTGRKSVIFHPALMPDIAVLHPPLTQGLPPDITATTGIDALTHNLEAYFSPNFHPIADGIALEALRLIIANLTIAYTNGTQLEARGKMQLAALMGATAFQKGLGMVHSMAHPLSAEYDIHHGLANALLLSDSVAFLENSHLNKDRQDKLKTIQALFQSTDYKANQLSDTLKTFIGSFNIDIGLHKHGVQNTDLAHLSQLAFEDECHKDNMIPISERDLLKVYKAAF